MSKGRRPKVRTGVEPEPVMDPRKPSSPEEGTGDGNGGVSEEPECWDFQLVKTTREAEKVKRGMRVSGLINNKSVGVSASFGLLGYAPANIAREIIEMNNQRGRKLQGEIISEGKASDASVHLCLR